MPDPFKTQFPTRDIRDIGLDAGSPAAFESLSSKIAKDVDVPNQSQLFGLAVMDLLRQAQQFGTRPAVEQELNAREAQTRRQAFTAPELVGAAPSVQAQARTAEVSALQPTIAGAKESQRTFGEQIKGFSDAISAARQFTADYENQQAKARDDARAIIKDAFTIGGADALKDLAPEELTRLEKASGYPKGYIQGVGQTLRERELELKRQQADLGVLGVGSTATGIISPETGKAEDVLKGVDLGTAQIVRNLTEYKIPLPSGFALRSPYWQRILGLASQYDPSFDATQYNVRLKLKQDFTSGKSAQNIRSLNTVIGHLDTLKNKGNALNNSPIPIWNRIVNFGLTQTGDKRVVEFLNAANAVESELATVFKGTGATDQEIKVWRASLNDAQSPQQITGAINTALELANSRAEALRGQYEVGLGRPKDFHFLNPRSRQILRTLGQDPDLWDPVAGGSIIERGGRRLQVM